MPLKEIFFSYVQALHRLIHSLQLLFCHITDNCAFCPKPDPIVALPAQAVLVCCRDSRVLVTDTSAEDDVFVSVSIACVNIFNPVVVISLLICQLLSFILKSPLIINTHTDTQISDIACQSICCVGILISIIFLT